MVTAYGPSSVQTGTAVCDYNSYFNRLGQLLVNATIISGAGELLSAETAVARACDMILRANAASGKVILIGNGGSAAIASHQALDFWHGAGIRATAFNDSAQLTCLANDYGYENVFSKAIEMFGQKEDVLLAISSSGKSHNILKAVAEARKKGCAVITYAGFSKQCPLISKGDLNFYIDSDRYGLVELAHMALIHYLTDTLAERQKRKNS